ncbi:tyrosine-type recombinase/integrase [Pseudomonas edaphica]|uniref:tyrosine-type recombinase/integrase n=1 Tax=Pseudomonas edaphica TaxID=2006980 RepID=UPI003D1222CB
MMNKRTTNYPSHHKLYTLIPDLKLYEFYSEEKLTTLSGHNMPFMEWPDRTPCLIANLYVLELRKRPGRKGDGPSRFGTKGGSFGEYATKISHLIRFCYYNKLNFIHLSNEDFYQFMDGLRSEINLKTGDRKRTERTLSSIGRRCIHFLSYVGRLHQQDNFVGIDGTIEIQIIDTVQYRNGRAFRRSSVHHGSFRVPSAAKTRKPITEANIERLRDAVDQMPTSAFIRERRQLMISIYEETGGRRSEINNLTIDNIMTALSADIPELRIKTLKNGVIETRMIPISPMLIEQMVKFIRIHRITIIEKLPSDHGYLFIAERGGHQLANDTLTSEFSDIRRFAGIEEQACGHMFRHAFCTHIAAYLISEVQATSPDSFRQTLMTNKMIAERAKKLSGHSDLESFLGYVDAAFKQVSKFSQIIKNARSQQVYMEYERRRKHLIRRLAERVITVDQYIEEEDSLTKARDLSLEKAQLSKDG